MAKTALITGASRGLGAHLAKRFWHSGWSLILVARSIERHADLGEKFRKTRDQTIEIMPCDLASPIQIEELCLSIKNRHSTLDVLINNAAIQGPIGPLADNNLLCWESTIQLNLLAPVALSKEMIPLLSKGKNPSIINLSGGGATSPRPNFSAYAASKAGLVRFSETLAEELRPAIKVNCIAPGAMSTKMLEGILESSHSAGDKEITSVKRVLLEGGVSMDRVADLALFLASSKSNGISGKLISAIWDNWEAWPNHLDELNHSDIYSLRRILGKDRGIKWGDK
jgi:NAD(P)-dependent dehydrogenase (short-subunit alcohol dehydrogenase family)